MNLCFDMDGTLANLYGVDNWLDFILKEDSTPYEIAEPLLNLSYFARLLNKLKKSGYRLYIISWLAKDSSLDYKKKVELAKRNWLKLHLPSVTFDNIFIVNYGENKSKFVNGNSILFDDDEKVRSQWSCGDSFDEKQILTRLRELAT